MVWTANDLPGVVRNCGVAVYRRLRGVVVQVLAEPALDLGHAHPLAFVVVGDLIAVDLAEDEVARFRVGEVEAAYARSGPHGIRLRNLHPGIRLDIEQTPDGTLLRMVGACRIACCGLDSAIFLLNEFRVAETFVAAVAPVVARALVQAFG